MIRKILSLPYHYFWLLLVFGVVLYTRLYHGWEPVPTYWDDFADEIIAPRNILDFNAHHWVFDVGRREPFFSYFTAFLWLFIPSAHGLVVQRLSCLLLSLLTVWVLYLLGKELSGRRAGFLLAALGAVNTDMWIKSLLGMRIASLPLAVALLLLYTLRVFRRPDAKHLIQWSFALAFGFYTYTAYRALPLPVVLAVLFFLSMPVKGMDGLKPFKACVVAILGLFLFYYFTANSLILGGFFNDGLFQGLFLLLLVVLLFVGGWLAGRTAGLEEKPNDLANGAMAISLASLLMFPMLAQRAISNHMAGLSVFTLPLHGLGGYLQFFAKRFLDAFKLLVGHGVDRMDLSPPGASMLGWGVAVLALLGLAFSLFKRDIKGGLCGLLVLSGLTPYLLTTEPHSGKLSGVVVPALALVVLGVELFLESRLVKKLGVLGPVAVLAVLGGLGTWQVRSNLKMIYKDWPTRNRNAQVEAYRQVKSDLQNHEVYFASLNPDWLSWETQGILEEGRDIHPFQDTNSLLLQSGRKLQGILVYMPPQDEEDLQKITRFYHAVVWDVKGPAGQVFFRRVEVPINEIVQEQERRQQKRHRQQPNGPFVIRESNDRLVHRRFYGLRYGLGRGLARGEDWVSSLKEPLPEWVKKGFGAQLVWDMDLKSAQPMKREPSYINKTWWWLDGQTVKDGADLPLGNHRLECFVELQNGLDLPVSPF